MAVTRITHKIKITSNDDPDLWVELERLDKLIVERGTGFAYQKTVYSFNWQDGGEGTISTFDDDVANLSADKKYITKYILDPALSPDTDPDTSNSVAIPVLVSVAVESSTGFTYRKTILTFDNTDQNTTRQVHTKEVKKTGLKVEVIDKMKTASGIGFAWDSKYYSFNDQGDEQSQTAP